MRTDGQTLKSFQLEQKLISACRTVIQVFRTLLRPTEFMFFSFSFLTVAHSSISSENFSASMQTTICLHLSECLDPHFNV